MRPMARRGPDFKVYTIMIASLARRRHFPPGKGGVADSDGGPAPIPPGDSGAARPGTASTGNQSQWASGMLSPA